ncbi:hypothetical protein B0H67DRAFT_388929 [Lasiosphaeris hirsuta]|uniref:C2H2-type domain-containing protein n=1 Tax=Lasiosphaeris hirsuta TaxID=260670 RepID=A0AA39ZXW0_9PEZI|nr:hypothetical protein B0H67DRAFT_388929 [Lasiosphaeris hirsuta]
MPDRPATPARRFAARSARGISVRSSSRPSSLRNAVSAGEGERPEAENTETNQFESQETDTSDSECETAKKSDDETDLDTDDDDNEWSGQNGNLESVVIAAVEGDLGLAAHLIPLLHRDFSLALKSKVESWQCTTAHGSTADGSPNGSGAKSSYAETLPDQSPGMSRKRRRTGSDERARKAVGGWDGEDEDEEDDSKDPSPPGTGEPQQLLACPFHKRDSVKYGIQHGNSGSGKKHKYRACTGPGFKSIQRLKEHLKRVHSPVQCERCHEIFPGTDRAACLARLAEHRKMDKSCELGDSSKKEGIDEAQWAALDKQNRRKNQETHRVEKWFEIWDVLFPAVTRPKSPCKCNLKSSEKERGKENPVLTVGEKKRARCCRDSASVILIFLAGCGAFCQSLSQHHGPQGQPRRHRPLGPGQHPERGQERGPVGLQDVYQPPR